eukprot:8367903-Karenia_brevis.AAC.1
MGALLQAIQDGALAASPVLDGLVTAIVQRATYGDKAGLRGRNNFLSVEQMDHVALATLNIGYTWGTCNTELNWSSSWIYCKQMV